MRLTVAQALVRFLASQYSERDGVRQRLVPGCFGIFVHGNVAGVAQGLLQAHEAGEACLPYYMAREADAVPGAGTRYSGFTAASRTAFAGPGVRFVILNIAAFDAGKPERAREYLLGAGTGGRP